MIEKLNYEYGQSVKVEDVVNKINEVIEVVNERKAEDEKLINMFRNMGITVVGE